MDRGLNNSILRGESSDCKVRPLSSHVTTDDSKRMCQASSEDKKLHESESTNCDDKYQNSYIDYQKQGNDTTSDSENSKSALVADEPGRKFVTEKLRPNVKHNRMPGDHRTRLAHETVQSSSKQRANRETPCKVIVTHSIPRSVSPAEYHSAKSVGRQLSAERRRFSGDRRQRSRSHDNTVRMTHRSTFKDFQEKHFIADDRLRVANRKFRSDMREFDRRISTEADRSMSSAAHNFTRRRSESRNQMCTNVVAYDVHQISNDIEALNQQHCPPSNVVHRTCVRSGNMDRRWARSFKRTHSFRGRIVSLNQTSRWKPNKKYGVHSQGSAWDRLDSTDEFAGDDARMRQLTEYVEGDRPDYSLQGPSPVVHQFEDRLSSPWNGDCGVQPRRPVRSRLGWRKPSYHQDLQELPYKNFGSTFKRDNNRGLIPNSWNRLNESGSAGRERRFRRFSHESHSHADTADQVAVDKEQLKSRTSEIFSGSSVNRCQKVIGVGRKCSRPSKSDWEDIVSESLSNLRRTAENRGTVSDPKNENNRSCHHEVKSSNSYVRKMCGNGFVDERCDLDRFSTNRRSRGRVYSRWSSSPSTSKKRVADAQSNSDSKRDSKAVRANTPSFEQDRKVKSGSVDDNNADHDVILLSYSDDDCSDVGHISSKNSSRTSVRSPVGFKKAESAAARELITVANEVESNKTKQNGPHTPVIDEICSPTSNVSDGKLNTGAVNTNDLTLNTAMGARSAPVNAAVWNPGRVTNSQPHHAVAATAPAWPTYPPQIESTLATLTQPEAALWMSSQLKTGSSQSVYRTNWPTVADQQLPQFVNGSASAIYSANSLLVEAPNRNTFNDVPANTATLVTHFAGAVAVPQYGINQVTDGFSNTGGYSIPTSQNSASMFAPPVELDVYGDSPLLDEPMYQSSYATTVDGSSVAMIDSGSLASVCQSLPNSTDVVQPPVFSVIPSKQASSTADTSQKVVQKDKLLPTDRLERIADEVKAALRPYFVSGQIDKEEYKDIMRRAVPKINASKTAGIDPKRIKYFVTEYVSKVKMAQKRVVADKLQVSGAAM